MKKFQSRPVRGKKNSALSCLKKEKAHVEVSAEGGKSITPG